MKKTRIIIITLFSFLYFLTNAQKAPADFQNPILSGFNPDPSICRVGDDYYLVTSSFVWYPGIPIYHSRDLVNWELIGHGLSRPDMVSFEGVKDKNGIWAPTIRYYNGLYYLITTASGCGGNFYITASNPAGQWSNPVWLKDAPGIDPSLMWDNNGKCYYSGNRWDFKKDWPGQCAIWAQELDLKQQKLIGKRVNLTFGYANNSGFAESPHIYRMDSTYLLMIAEGGTDANHSITVHHSDSILKRFTADKVNPVLSHRTLGKAYPIQCVGHGDLVQTQKGDWWAVVLGKRMIDGEVPLSRETFLCKVEFEAGTPIFNPGYGKVLSSQSRPDLPWTPVKHDPARDEFNSDTLLLKWHTIRTPKGRFYDLKNGVLSLQVRPEVIDSLVNASVLIQSIRHSRFSATTKLSFNAKKANEQAGLILYRTNESYYMLLKEESRLVLVEKYAGKKQILATVPYLSSTVYLNLKVDRLTLQFSFGDTPDKMTAIGSLLSMKNLCESQINKFNGTGVGVYATSNGKQSDSSAFFDWFEYLPTAGIGMK